MEFKSRKACIEHYQEQYPNLPRYMIEMALNYDLSEGAHTNEKPLTGSKGPIKGPISALRRLYS
jgi:hypothetical protein